MKKSTFFIILLLVAVLVYLYSKANAVKNIVFSPALPRKFKTDGFAIAWEQGLEADNGDFLPVTVNNVVAKIYNVDTETTTTVKDGKTVVVKKDNDIEIGTVTLIQDTTIRANAITVIPLKIRIPVSNLLNLIIGTIEDVKNRKFRFKLKGTVRGESVQVPLDISFNYLIPSF